ncbi:MAG: methyltransferase [Desulfurococcales archaeon]|nr:methyltransferase [Desulfurococcales archaeon]
MEVRVVEAGGLKLRICIHPCVYNPSDDTMAAVEAIAKAASLGLRAESVVDLGTGTGILALAAHKILAPARILAVDHSPYAVKTARCTLSTAPAVVARCNGSTCISGGFDLAISNPPYLGVDDKSLARGECEEWLYTSWGPTGLLEDVVAAAPRLARALLIVYSTLSPLDPERELARHGYKVLARVEKRFFMETIRAVVLERRG